MCDDYAGAPWDIVNDSCWQLATSTEKVDFAVRALILASVVVVFLLGFLVMRK